MSKEDAGLWKRIRTEVVPNGHSDPDLYWSDWQAWFAGRGPHPTQLAYPTLKESGAERS